MTFGFGPRDALVMAAAIFTGYALQEYDKRTDDTGVEAALLVAIALAFTLAAPRRALAIGLAVGLPIVVWSLMFGNGAAFIALAFSLFGAGLGWLMRRGSPRAAG